MIDEELYQQAADELNTDRRRAHIWARACALASDDHDEARYLYTNLRVEELIAERDAGGHSDGAANVRSNIVEEHDATLALEPVNFTEDAAEDASAFISDDEFTLGEMDDPTSSSVSAPSGKDLREDTDDLFQLLATEQEETESSFVSQRMGVDEQNKEPDTTLPETDLDYETATENPMERDFLEKSASSRLKLDDTLDDTSELDGTAVIDFDSDELAEFQASIPAEDFDTFEAQAAASLDDSNDVLQNNNDELEDLLEGVFPAEAATSAAYEDEDPEAVLTADFSDASGTQAIVLEEELDWLDEEVASDPLDKPLQTYQSDIPDRDDTDRLTQELERQADELPGQHSDVVAHSPPTQPDISPVAEQDVPLNDESAAEPNVAAAAAVAAAGTAAAAFTAAPAHTHSGERSAAQEYPLDLSTEDSGSQYSVYRRDRSLQAVKNGVSWSALILTLPFLIYRQLFGTAVMYVIMSAILLAGLAVMGLAWFDAGATATPVLKAGTIAFAVMSAVGLFYLPFRYGNTWRGDKLENRGFEQIARVRAKNPGKAISQARRAAALD